MFPSVMNCKLFLFLTLISLVMPSRSGAQDFNYRKIAQELEKTNKNQQVQKVAVLPFEDLSSKESKLGKVVQEELTFALVRHTKFVVTERAQVNKVLGELEFQLSGAIDAKSAKKLGMGLGADGIITGTISRDQSQLKLNARLIATENFAILAVAQDSIETYGSPGSATYVHRSMGKLVLQLLAGYGFTKSRVYFGKPVAYPLVEANQVGIPQQGQSYRTISLGSFEEKAIVPPIGVRFLLPTERFGHSLAVGFEFLYESLTLPGQTVSVVFNETDSSSWSFSQNYLRIAGYEMGVPILYKFGGRLFSLYGGVSLGANFSSYSSDYIQSYHYASSSFRNASSELGFGLQGYLLAGTLWHFTEILALTVEGRYMGFSAEFNRDGKDAGFLLSEDMEITRSGFLVFWGMAFVF